ncbi:MAG: M24 family metallopeptidase [Rhodothermales bacterium]
MALLVLAGCGAPPPGPHATPGADAGLFTGDPWPEIRAERLDTLLPAAMERHGMDAWMIICRENNNDPLARHVGCENAGGTAAFLLFRQAGEGSGSTENTSSLYSVAVSPAGESTALAEKNMLDEVVSIGRGVGLWGEVAAQFERFNPAVIGINTGGSPIADGLSHTQYESMMAGLPAMWTSRMTSAEPLVRTWLSVKLPAEVDIMRRAAELTARWEVEAYAEVVPGVTTDRDLADILEEKMAAAGVGDGWSPEQNPAINSGMDRGHSHPTDRVIVPGDFIQTDFGIRVHDMWVTDIQRFAYVLAPGETEAPADALAKWEAARAGNRAAFAAMKPGATGADVDAAQRVVMEANGSIPVMWGTGHPVGYWAHDSGPGLSGRSTSQPLEPGMTFAFDGFHSWMLTDSTTKTISVEEMVVITETGAEWLTPPQEDLILIPSR